MRTNSVDLWFLVSTLFDNITSDGAQRIAERIEEDHAPMFNYEEMMQHMREFETAMQGKNEQRRQQAFRVIDERLLGMRNDIRQLRLDAIQEANQPPPEPFCARLISS